VIELHEVGFSYGNADVLRGVSLAVRPGERVVLLGRNGSGKSTLSRLMNGSLLASSGEVVVDGITAVPGQSPRLSATCARTPGIRS
jgi:ABC-type bacteriocin/lantibiotic exporter with double-glycine peptidase domain